MSNIPSLPGFAWLHATVNHFIYTAFSRLLIVVICGAMAGCSKIVVKTDWPEFLSNIGHDSARVSCRSNRNIDSADYKECLNAVDRNYADWQTQRQAEMKKIDYEKSRCYTPETLEFDRVFNGQITPLNLNGSCKPISASKIDFYSPGTKE
ncbi:hypothetical protein JYT79_02290 [Cardiobacterium sp. AH-315-I02]|nr:hypothetical protein [Cardiobacterium sp. AH-315-I02]